MRRPLLNKRYNIILLIFLIVFGIFSIFQGNSNQLLIGNNLTTPDTSFTSSGLANVTQQNQYYYLRNQFLELRITNDTAAQQFKSLVDGTIFWEGAAAGHSIEITHADNSYSGILQDIAYIGSAALTFWAINGTGYADLFVRYSSGWNVAGINITCHYRMYSDDSGMEVSYSVDSPSGLPAAKALREITAFGQWNLQTTLGSEGYFVLPYRSTGILAPLSLARQDPTQGPNFGTYEAKYPQDWTMQFVGMVVDSSALLIYANDSYGFSKECLIKFQTTNPYFKLSDYRILAQSSSHYDLPYFWKFRLLAEESDYVDIAKEYKTWAESSPFYEPIDEKIARYPELQNVTRTGIALHGHHWGGTSWYTFSESISQMKNLKTLYGLTHAIIHETMWRKDHTGTFDDWYPEYTPPSSARGGESAYTAWAMWLDQNGYILLPHTDSVIWDGRSSIYQADYRALDYNGNPEAETYWSTASWFMSQYAIRTVEQAITTDILALGASGRFLDIIGRGQTAYGEDYNTYIPAAYQPYGEIYGTKELLDLQNATGAILGTEAFIEPLNPYFPYISGRIWLPYDDVATNFFGFRHEGDTRFVQVPLWSLVYHETAFLAEHDLYQYGAKDMYDSTYPNNEYGAMTRLENVENGALMMIDIQCASSYSQLAKDVIDYQKYYYHEIYNAEMVDHYYINGGIDKENPTTWDVAVSVFKNPNDEYIISVCNYDSTAFTKTWKDNNSNRDISITALGSMEWQTIHINRTEDDLRVTFTTSATSIESGNSVNITVTVMNDSSLQSGVRVELIIGWETFIDTTDIQGKAYFLVEPLSTGTLEVEIVAIQEGYDYGRASFSLSITSAPIPSFKYLFIVLGFISLLLLFRKNIKGFKNSGSL